ncbi:hypothetical protein BVRB_035800, partial [Beta vulgaris subsp. vulgaris]
SNLEGSGNRTFQLRGDSSVPGFLKDIALPILQCVKTLHQLRLSKVAHRIGSIVFCYSLYTGANPKQPSSSYNL